jgi:hypothetical protein
MMKSNFRIPKITPDVVELIDLGPWDHFSTITNDAEAVVKYLFTPGCEVEELYTAYQATVAVEGRYS